MYTIEIRYQTGNSFNTEECTEVIGLVWEDKQLARKALQSIKEHYKLYEESEECFSWRQTRTKEEIIKEVVTKDWYKKATKSEWDERSMSFYLCAAEMDNGEWRNMPMFWLGYFETLHEAKIVCTEDDEDSFQFSRY